MPAAPRSASLPRHFPFRHSRPPCPNLRPQASVRIPETQSPVAIAIPLPCDVHEALGLTPAVEFCDSGYRARLVHDEVQLPVGLAGHRVTVDSAEVAPDLKLRLVLQQVFQLGRVATVVLSI